jgi:hypothetical protein
VFGKSFLASHWFAETARSPYWLEDLEMFICKNIQNLHLLLNSAQSRGASYYLPTTGTLHTKNKSAKTSKAPLATPQKEADGHKL